MSSAGRAPQPEDRRQVMAAIDLGSNSFHMIVARYEHGQLTVIDRLREMVRLAGGLGKDGRIKRDAAERALQCLGRFGQRLSDIAPENIRAVGTNALRKAKNASDFLSEAEYALGHSIEVVSGREEARLVYLGAVHSIPDQVGSRLVVDIGGGSTELIIGQQLEIHERISLYMGCVSLTEKYFPNGKITAKRWKRARVAASLELEPISETLRQQGWEGVIGTSGTIRTTQAVVRAQGWSDDAITPAALASLRDHMLAAGNSDAFGLEGLSAERAPVFVGGVVVLQAVCEALEITAMRAAKGALREGLIYDMIGRMSDEDARDRSVRSLQRRYHVDGGQARRVEHTAMMMFSQVKADWQLEDALSRELLTWSARVHEIGLGIAHAQYHKHGAYLLEHSDLAGFSNRERHLLATMVLAHRRKMRSAVFKALPSPWSKRLIYLSALLRLSVLFHRSRT
ncbi:MAG: exopolyphosphatase, partial [Gammaproteobacteria bacterium]|nr:exopolyphosphatase [Gammaproteobacteria bacterium]